VTLGLVRRGLNVLLSLLAAVAAVRPALAQSQSGGPPPSASNAPAKPSLWREEWPEFRMREGLATLAADFALAAIVIIGPAEQPRWRAAEAR